MLLTIYRLNWSFSFLHIQPVMHHVPLHQIAVSLQMFIMMPWQLTIRYYAQFSFYTFILLLFMNLWPYTFCNFAHLLHGMLSVLPPVLLSHSGLHHGTEKLPIWRTSFIFHTGLQRWLLFCMADNWHLQYCRNYNTEYQLQLHLAELVWLWEIVSLSFLGQHWHIHWWFDQIMPLLGTLFTTSAVYHNKRNM